MLATVPPREPAKAAIDRSIRQALGRTSGKPRARFLDFLAAIRGRSDLLRPAWFRGRVDAAWLDAMLGALLRLVEYRHEWRRPIETWGPAGPTPLALFASLAHHLLAEYPVPPVLLSAWFVEGYAGNRPRQWFLRAARGQSLRVIGLPLDLGRRMAHEFAQAPAHYPIDFALRWAQVRGLGGSDGLARAVAATRIGRDPEEHPIWVELIQLLIRHPRFDRRRLGAAVDYMIDRKFAERLVIIGADTHVTIDPPEPELTLRGWTGASLLRRVAEWEARRPARPEAAKALIRWDRSAIAGCRHVDPAGQAWTIRELLDSDALAAEGEAMDHCVATYTNFCSKRLSTIWSVARDDPAGPGRAATVEVDPAGRRIIQAQARSNTPPDPAAIAAIRHWADRAGLAWEDAEGAAED